MKAAGDTACRFGFYTTLTAEKSRRREVLVSRKAEPKIKAPSQLDYFSGVCARETRVS